MQGANGVQIPLREAKPQAVNSQGKNVTKDDQLANLKNGNFKDLVNEAMESEKKPKIVDPENKPQDKAESGESTEDTGDQAEVILTLQQMQAQIALANTSTGETKTNKGEPVTTTAVGVETVENTKAGNKPVEVPTNLTESSKEGLKEDGGKVQNNVRADIKTDNGNQTKNLLQGTDVKLENEVKQPVQAVQPQVKATTLEETATPKGQGVATNQTQTNVAANEQGKAQNPKQTQPDGGKQATGTTGTTENSKTVAPTNTKSNNDVKQDVTKEGNAKAKSESEETKTSELLTTTKTEKLDATKVNIKVAEPYTANTENKMFAKQVAEKIVFSSNEGAREIEIQLMPKDLGKVTIKLIFEGNNALVQMTATNAKAQNILNLNAEGIKHIVETNTNTNVVVSVNDENKLNQQRDQFDGKGERQAKEEEPKKKDETLDEDSQITFVNQLRLGLLNKNVS